MGLTERHWFEDEEPELTENQLEDILWENNKIFERGYQEGFSDGKSALLQEQEPITIIRGEWKEYWGQEYTCPVCLMRWMAFNKHNNETANYCPGCGRAIKWCE